mmetsp:Transcript_36956/g.35669  ORF Transcript_36956/g.35669 Transcript_36956/m.35669 type:complete len:140 (+) Transcript_36956:362-781(+)
MADISYSIKQFEDLGAKLKFTGYNHKLMHFIETFIGKMLERMTPSGNRPNQGSVENAVEKLKKIYQNLNVEVDQRCANNRLNFMLPDHFHAKLMLKEIEAFHIDDFTDFFLQQNLLWHLKEVRVLVSGNIDQAETLEFY